MSLPGEPRWRDADDELLVAPPEPAERTVAVWHPDMSDATYGRLLRLLFDPDPEGGGDGPTTGKAA